MRGLTDPTLLVLLLALALCALAAVLAEQEARHQDRAHRAADVARAARCAVLRARIHDLCQLRARARNDRRLP